MQMDLGGWELMATMLPWAELECIDSKATFGLWERLGIIGPLVQFVDCCTSAGSDSSGLEDGGQVTRSHELMGPILLLLLFAESLRGRRLNNQSRRT